MDAADSTTNSSKVIVQCHDPSDLFDRVISRLEPRLPLSKLHWKSPNRPLRSIDQLNVSFVRDDSKSDAATGARRHQIPGLRQTPFVKIFLARCDERETYKETCRKEVKQWLKSQGISQDGKTLMKGQERHDAYEYIILHVVLPGTPAAAQPKSSKHISLETYDSTDSVNSKSKWTGKGSSTIYDKLKADFSSSSKAPFERVAQIRLTDPENKQVSGLGPSEIEELWQEFVEKLRTAILLSFDARVSQYEEDIRDREAQRQLPGWNFCTFFVLKEGLARGFENVGLIEDALTVYDELDVGLDSLVQEQASTKDPDPTTALLPFSSDLKPAIRSALDATNGTLEVEKSEASDLGLQELIDLEREHFPFDVERSNYQQRILTNQVSALDFHTYIFTRQLQLLFRQAKLTLSISKSKTSINSLPKALYDLNVITSICEKATSFLTFAARALRRDLFAAWGGQEGLDEEELRTQQSVIGGLVASWKWSAVMQILSDCQVLPLLVNVLVKTIPLPERSTDISRPDNTPSVNGQTPPPNGDLALWVGELISMAKDVLNTAISSKHENRSENGVASGLRSKSLCLLYSSKPKASSVARLLTTQAYRCFKAANRINGCHLMLHALAEIELNDDNLDDAIRWLELVPELSNLHARTATDRAILNLYARCLKSRARFDQYAKTLTALLLSSAVSPVARALPRFDEQTQFVLNELVDVSHRVSEFELPLGGFVAIQSIPKAISHIERSNCFFLSLSLSLRFKASLRISGSELTISSEDQRASADIILKGTDTTTLDGSTTELNFASDVITEGWYNLTRLTLRVGNLILVHDFQSIAATEDTGIPRNTTTPAPIMVYPHSEVFYVSAKQSTVVDLTRADCLLLELNVGDTDINKCTLGLRPASAGIRLDTQSVTCLDEAEPDRFEIVRQDNGNTLVMQNLAKNSTVKLEVPYTTENFLSSIDIKVEAACETEADSFRVSYQRSVAVNLPISVDVQDVFQKGKLFSRFTATPSTIIPVRLLRWDIGPNNDFDVDDGQLPQEPVEAYSKMPASWVVKVADQRSSQVTQAKLPLLVKYHTWDELILNQIESQFYHDVQESPVSSAARLLTSHMLSQLSMIWSEQDLESAVLLQEFEIYSYDDLDWHIPLRALGTAERKQMEAWLRSWHERHHLISLSSENARTRIVKLSVSIPRPSVVVSTSLEMHMSGKQYLAVGEPASAELVLDCIYDTDCEAEIQFDVVGQSDAWLIGGKKRGMITCVTEQTITKLILVPQKAGHLLLPGIDIRCRGPNDRRESSSISVEIENRSQAKTVLVIPNLQSSTIGVGIDATVGRHWTVETRKRQVAT